MDDLAGSDMHADEAGQLTLLLQEWKEGSDSAELELYRLLNDELRRLAKRLLWKNVDAEIQPTVLVNQLYLKLGRATKQRMNFANRRVFFKYASVAMERILIDHHKRRRTQATVEVPELDRLLVSIEEDTGHDIEKLHVALNRLARQSPKQHEVIMLRYFGGLTIADTAGVLGLSSSAIEIRTKLARAKLYRMMKETKT